MQNQSWGNWEMGSDVGEGSEHVVDLTKERFLPPGRDHTWSVQGGHRLRRVGTIFGALMVGAIGVLMGQMLDQALGGGYLPYAFAAAFFIMGTLATAGTMQHWIQRKSMRGDFGVVEIDKGVLRYRIPGGAVHFVPLDPAFQLLAVYEKQQIQQDQALGPLMVVGPENRSIAITCNAIPHQRVSPSLGLVATEEPLPSAPAAVEVLPLDFLEILATLRRIKDTHPDHTADAPADHSAIDRGKRWSQA